MTVTVRSVEFVREVTTDEGQVVGPKEKDAVYVIVDLTVQNRGDTPLRVTAEDVALITEDDATLSQAAYTHVFPREYVPLKGSIAPGKKKSGMVTFIAATGSRLGKVVVSGEDEVAIGLDGLEAKRPQAASPPRIGQTAKGGGISIVVHSVTYPAKLTHGLWTTTAKPGNRLVVVDITVRNLELRPKFTVLPMDVALVDQKGRLHVSGMTVLGMPSSAQLHTTKLKPGRSTRGKLVTTLGKNRQLKRIRYEVGVLGPPLEVLVRR